MQGASTLVSRATFQGELFPFKNIIVISFDAYVGHLSRFPYTISPVVDVRNYQSTHIQGSETVQTTVHYPAGASQEVVIGSTTTSVCLNQPDIVPSNKVECKYSYDVDVVTLEDI